MCMALGALDYAPTPSTLAQSKKRKGSNFAIWQPCLTDEVESCLDEVVVDLLKVHRGEGRRRSGTAP